MLRLMENKITLGFKLETTAYTAETLAATDYNQRAYDVEISPEIESYGRKLVRGDYSRDVSISGRRKATVSFSIDVYPGSAVNVAPKYFDCLRACGYKQTAFGVTGISIVPHADYNRVPATIEVVFPEEGTSPRGLVFKVAGAMGKATFTCDQIGQPIKIRFEFTGVLASVTTRAFASILLPTSFDASLPPAVLAATFSMFGTIQFPSKFTIEGGEDVQLFGNPGQASGYDGARVVDRRMSMTTDPDMVVTSDQNLYETQINNTTGQLTITVGGSVPLVMSAPVIQIAEGNKPGKREGHITNELKLELQRSTNGNDEFELLQGAKS